MGTRNRFAVIVLAGAHLWISGCSCAASMQASREQAASAIADFHGRYNGESFDQIVDEAADEFKKSAPRENLVKFLRGVHRRLGKVKNSKETGWRVHWQTNGTFVITSHAAEFEQGTGVETFTIVIRDGKAQLVGYNVNSDKLIME